MRYIYTFYELGFNQGSSIFQAGSGKVFLGGIDGLISFDEEKLKGLSKNYRIYFDKLYVNNKPVLPGDENHILQHILAKTPSVRLKSSQNNITIHFSSSNYSHDNDRVYEYKLHNYDKEWIQTTSHSFTYTNLNPGKYTLQLREVSGTREPDLQISLDLEIHSPFYATSVAYIFYTILISSLFYIFVSFQNKQAHLKASLEYERKQKLQIEELNQIKLNFFTNISHEFRTPLTLIIGQVEYLLQSNKFSPAIYNRLLRIYKNTWHMRDLITELLDFRKQELRYMQLKVEYRDVVAYTKEIFMSFYEYVLTRHITYKYEPLEDKIELWFDLVQLRKVFFNLLSNAFKYTGDGGSITVIVRKNMQAVEIIFKDDGPGIHKDQIKKIFDRFYQADTLNSEFTTGTGIGLAVTKGIVELHKGTIEVNSDPGRGTEFTITLLLGKKSF
ncbi:MAG: ATP-binding protein [Bacteroides sp.]|nr:ATP-binding protein [Bacteroides sp.]